MNDYIDKMGADEARHVLRMSEDAHSMVREVCRQMTGVKGIPFVDDCVAVSIAAARWQAIRDYRAYLECSR